MADFSGGPVTGDLGVRWIHGSRSKAGGADPLLQVHRYDEHTYILRQSMTVSHEAPFLYLFFGSDRGFLLDTGATKDAATFPLRETVDRIVSSWRASHRRTNYELVVAHTHAHGDHTAGDGQFADRPLTTVVAKDEPPLPMTMAQLRAVRDAAHVAVAKPGVYVHDDFVIASGMGQRTIRKLLIRSRSGSASVDRALEYDSPPQRGIASDADRVRGQSLYRYRGQPSWSVRSGSRRCAWPEAAANTG